MRIGIIGRSELLYNTARRLASCGHEIALVLTAEPAPEYRRDVEDFARLADEYDAVFLKTARINSKVSEIAAVGSMDIGISVNYPGMIEQPVIDLFPFGILNAHGGDLPRYRGNACQAWAILNGETSMGLCVHKMVAGELDSGDIIARDYCPINAGTTVTDLWDWMGRCVPVLFEKAVAALQADPDFILERQSNSPSDSLRCYPRRPEDGLIDWRLDALSIVRLINASAAPYPGAYTHLNRDKLVIWSGQAVEDGEKFCAVPGQVTLIGDGFVDVATGSGKVRLTRIELEGGGPLLPSSLIRSIRERLG